MTWTNVLFVNEHTSATELVMDPANNKVLYAATYQRQRSNWGFNGGGPGSAMYKSSDAGKTWVKLTKGIPEGQLGRIGLDIYRKNPNVVYARIEHETESGVYRSDDAGASWKKMSGFNPRPMYFGQSASIHRTTTASTSTVYEFHISDDGGRTFIGNTVPHSDHHAIWIDPSNTNHVMTGSDGGVNVSWDRGATWDFLDNLVLGQFYHVGYDMDAPYRRVRRTAGQRLVGSAQCRPQQVWYRQLRLDQRRARRRLRDARRSQGPAHHLQRIARRQHAACGSRFARA